MEDPRSRPPCVYAPLFFWAVYPVKPALILLPLLRCWQARNAVAHGMCPLLRPSSWLRDADHRQSYLLYPIYELVHSAGDMFLSVQSNCSHLSQRQACYRHKNYPRRSRIPATGIFTDNAFPIGLATDSVQVTRGNEFGWQKEWEARFLLAHFVGHNLAHVRKRILKNFKFNLQVTKLLIYDAIDSTWNLFFSYFLLSFLPPI